MNFCKKVNVQIKLGNYYRVILYVPTTQEYSHFTSKVHMKITKNLGSLKDRFQ